jgi:membrane-associated phospholipid phosphatase
MKYLVIILVLFHSSIALSEETISQMLGRDFTSPINDPKKNYYLWAAGGIIFGEIFLQKVEKSFQKSTVTHKPLGKSSKIGDLLGRGLPNFIYFMGMEIDGDKNKAGVMLRASLISGLTTNVLKYTIREKRPDSNSRNSFPSGHTTMAFAFAGTIDAQHGHKWGLPAYIMATFAGYSRINDNKHYFFDVATGALIGTMYGHSISYRDKEIMDKITYDWLPNISHDEVGINVHISY